MDNSVKPFLRSPPNLQMQLTSLFQWRTLGAHGLPQRQLAQSRWGPGAAEKHPFPDPSGLQDFLLATEEGGAPQVVLVVKNPPANAGDARFNPWAGKILWRRKWQPTPAFLPRESHGQRSLAG